MPRDAYFPGADFWRSSDVAGSPRHVETSGIIQPPIHARAVLEVYEHAADEAEARAFVERLYPKLVALHRYLAESRDPDGIGLAAIVHPWESGLDNSPVWAAQLDALEIPPDGVPEYERRDVVNADPADRPTDLAYDRFVYLAAAYREVGYDDRTICERSPFVVVGPLFAALHLWSSLALAKIAEIVGDDPAPHRVGAAAIRRGMSEALWDEADGRFYTRNLSSDQLARKAGIISLMPVLDPELPRPQLAAIVADLRGPAFHPPESRDHYIVPSYDLERRLFDPRRYWRGPVWINTDWLIWRCLLQHAQADLADEVARSMLASSRAPASMNTSTPSAAPATGATGSPGRRR
ncbi:MAG: hypothetical protein M3406_16175 [Chloroflexota bacterium]|nr:hypothetical protein [Chloroflexota bacterium]